MKRFFNKRTGITICNAQGFLVQAPKPLRDDDIEYLVIGEDGVEYLLIANKKTSKMENLQETKVQVSGIITEDGKKEKKLKTITYKCIEDFAQIDTRPLSRFDDLGFDVSRFDYAI